MWEVSTKYLLLDGVSKVDLFYMRVKNVYFLHNIFQSVIRPSSGESFLKNEFKKIKMCYKVFV